ncbi:unnamed protein product [Auanema sp. JU1783]|nr:unnamed protein product [Auanema sp. JU1783]
MSDCDENDLDMLLDTLEADLDGNADVDFNDDESFVTCTSTLDRTNAPSVDGTFCSAVSSLTDDLSFRTVNEDLNDTVGDPGTPEKEMGSLMEPNVHGGGHTKRASKIIPLDFLCETKATEKLTSVLFGSDSEDDDLIEKENLNESGKSISKSLKSKSREEELRKPLPCPSAYKTPVVHKSVLTGLTDQNSVSTKTVAFDKFFSIRIRNPKISSIAFETLTEGLKKVRASDVRHGMADRFVTIGVIIDKSEVRKSANGKDYLMWRIHDLKDCQTQSLRVLLFGECCKEYWKLQAGTCVGLLSPEVGDQRDVKDKQVAVRVFKRAQVTDLGFCPSYGICKSIKSDSIRCSNFVNLDTSEFCIYHVVSQVRSLSSKRGTFNNISGAPTRRVQNAPTPNGLMLNKMSQQQVPGSKPRLGSDSMKPSSTYTPMASTAKVINKAEEKETLNNLMSTRSHLMGARNLIKLSQVKDVKPVVAVRHSSMADFMKDRMRAEVDSPRLGQGYSRGSIMLTGNSRRTSVDHEAARKRAIELYKRSKEKKTDDTNKASTQGIKRSATDDPSTPSKKSKIGSASKEDIEKILKHKFLSDKSADREENSLLESHLDKLEKKEKVENQITSCMSLKNVKVFTCKKCNYTAQKRSELCLRSGHAVVEHLQEKRFFKCKVCNRREIAYGFLPSKACQNCNNNDWERVALRDERKVTLENENLRVRGEEQKFINR